MKNWRRLLALLLAAVMAVSLCACKPSGEGNAASDPAGAGGFWDFFTGLFGSESTPPSDGSSADPEASATPEIVADLSQGPLEFAAGVSPGDVLLTVNGDEITADILLYWLDYNCYYFMYQYGAYLSMADFADMLLEDAVNLCASEVLLRQRAAQLGCLPTDAQVQEARDRIAGDPDTCELFRTAYGLTDESIEYLFLSDAYYDNMLAAATHEPSEEELTDYIMAQGVYRVKHILFKTVDDNRQPLSDDVIAQKRAQAEDVLAQLQAAQDLPALFDQLMNELSEDGRKSDGTLYAPDGYLAVPGGMVAEFETASKALKEGELSGIVESAFGYHIILRLPTAPFTDDEKADYRDSYRPDVLRDQVDQWLEDADVVWADALTNLDVAGFYARMQAYQQALSAQEEGVG